MEESVLELCSEGYLATSHYVSVIICVILTLFPLFHSIYSFCIQSSNAHGIFLISFIIVCILSIVFNVTSGLSIYGCNHYSNVFQRITRMISYGMYIILIEIALLIIIFRLDLSFKGTPFQVNNKLIRFYNISIIILLLTLTPSLVIATWYSNTNETIFEVLSLLCSVLCMLPIYTYMSVY